MDFICIGAQKAGTTWLYAMLRRHPQFWLPPVKELHYFDRSPTYPSENFLACDHPIPRLFGAGEYSREFQKKFRKLLHQAYTERSWATFKWSLRFGLGKVNDQWYTALFNDGSSFVRGEISPSYSMLDSQDVSRVKGLAPRLKIILLLRSPIERAWSQIRFDWARGLLGDIESFECVRQFVDSPRQALRGDYMRTLENWGTHFPPEQLFVGFYDDIAERPATALTSILQFLGCDPLRAPKSEDLRKKVHVSKKKEMPLEIRQYLATKYYNDLVRLADRFGGHPENWRRTAELFL